MCVHGMQVPVETREQFDPLKLELQTFVTHQISGLGTGPAQDQYSKPLNPNTNSLGHVLNSVWTECTCHYLLLNNSKFHSFN